MASGELVVHAARCAAGRWCVARLRKVLTSLSKRFMSFGPVIFVRLTTTTAELSSRSVLVYTSELGLVCSRERMLFDTRTLSCMTSQFPARFRFCHMTLEFLTRRRRNPGVWDLHNVLLLPGCLPNPIFGRPR